MNAYAILVVNQHLETLREEAAARRSVRVERPSLLERVAAGAASIKAALAIPFDPIPGMPTLTDYPYRS